MTFNNGTTLRKLWLQTGNSWLWPSKCWPLSTAIRSCSWGWPDVVDRISAHFSNFGFPLSRYVTKHLITGALGNSEFCFPRFSMFSPTPSWERLRFSGKKIHCSPQDRSLSVNYYSYSNIFFRLFCLFLTNCSILFQWLNKITLRGFCKYQ